jgi:hypothetical protein
MTTTKPAAPPALPLPLVLALPSDPELSASIARAYRAWKRNGGGR